MSDIIRTFCKRQISLSLLLCILAASLVSASKLPKGVVLPEGVVLPDDFELPEGIEIPEGFEITQEIVDQYMMYLETKKEEEEEPISGDQWFKQLAEEHPNAHLQMNVMKVDEHGANEESSFKDRLLNTLTDKEVILPVIAVIVLLAAMWGFMTKCGQRACCRDVKLRSGTSVAAQRTSAVSEKKSVKTERSETNTNNDIESNLEKKFAGHNDEVISWQDNKTKGTSGKTTELHQSKLVMQTPVAARQDTNSSHVQQRHTLGAFHLDSSVAKHAEMGRISSVSAPTAPKNSTANRSQLPTVSVSLSQIRMQRLIKSARAAK